MNVVPTTLSSKADHNSFAKGRRRQAAIRRGEDPEEAEHRYQRTVSERRKAEVERERIEKEFALERELEALRPRATDRDRQVGRVYALHYRDRVEGMAPVVQDAAPGGDRIAEGAKVWARIWFGDLGREDLDQEIEVKALQLARSTLPECGRDDGGWTHPHYIRTALQNHVKRYVRKQLKWKKVRVPASPLVYIGTMSHVDIATDLPLDRDSFKVALYCVVLSPHEIGLELRDILQRLRSNFTPAEDRAVVNNAIAHYLRDQWKFTVSEADRKGLNRLVSRHLPLVNRQIVARE